MHVGFITLNGMQVGVIEASIITDDEFVPDVEGYVPEGRAESGTGIGDHGGDDNSGYGDQGGDHHLESRDRKHSGPSIGGHRDGQHHHGGKRDGGRHGPGHFDRHKHQESPSGKTYTSEGQGRPFSQGSAETDAAIQRAAREADIDPNTMRGIASIESSMNPSSNANARTQYKGLYQIGHEEWRRFGQGNIYSAEDNAMATARMFKENKKQFRANFGRDPTDTELYMMHQQGLGFYTRGAMTNIAGNPYPGMHGPQTHESFEAGWGRELARRKAAFAGRNPQVAGPVISPEVTTVPKAIGPTAPTVPTPESEPKPEISGLRRNYRQNIDAYREGQKNDTTFDPDKMAP